MSKYSPVYIDPSVKIIDSDSVKKAYNLWLKSRESIVSRVDGVLKVGNEVIEDESEYIDRVMNMGLQYTNFPEFTLEIQGSALFRDILFTINKAPQWATSIRFINSTLSGFDVKNYPVSSEYKDIPEWEAQFDKYMDKIQETMITDENRVEMPYSMSSRYWIQFNWKTLVTFLSMLKIKMPFFYEVYGKLIEDAFGWESIDITKYYVPYIDASISQYFRYTVEPKEESTTYLDDTVIMNKRMGLLLFSQFIRQQDSLTKGLYDLVSHTNIEEFKHKMFYASTPLMISYTADYSRFMRTISNRLCWFSMSGGNGINSWSSVLDVVIKNLSTDSIKSMLPCRFCNDGSVQCKYYDDVKFRKEGVEKRNLPCSIFYKNIDYAIERDNSDKTCLSNAYVEITRGLK